MLVYMVRNEVNGKIYVGKTHRSLRSRWNQHKSDARLGSHLLLHRAIRKYGSDHFTLSILENAITSDEVLSAAEVKYIRQFSSKVPVGYNLTDGGEGISGVDASVIEKIRASKIGNDYGKYQRGQPKPKWTVERKVAARGIRRSQNTEFKPGVSYSPRTQFKKGATPWTKGRPRPLAVRLKISATKLLRNPPKYKECPVCLKSFTPSRAEGVYCSRACFGQAISGPSHYNFKHGLRAGRA